MMLKVLAINIILLQIQWSEFNNVIEMSRGFQSVFSSSYLFIFVPLKFSVIMQYIEIESLNQQEFESSASGHLGYSNFWFLL